METIGERLGDWTGEVVVVDCRSPFVALGRLENVGSDFLELADADLHDLRDTDTNRELYVVKSARHGVAANRAHVILRLDEVVGVARLADVETG